MELARGTEGMGVGLGLELELELERRGAVVCREREGERGRWE